MRRGQKQEAATNAAQKPTQQGLLGADAAQKAGGALYAAGGAAQRSKSASTILMPSGRLESATHSSRVWAPPPVTVPIVLAGIPRERGMLLSVEAGV